MNGPVMNGLSQARLLALLIPAGLLGGAYVSEYGFGLFPCEMCWWQRYPHFAAIGFGLASFLLTPSRVWVALAGLAIVTSGLIGGFHAGVEYGWWQGITGCSNMPTALNVMDINSAPLVRCDMAPWDLFGVSLAGWNFLISCIGGAAVVAMAAFKD